MRTGGGGARVAASGAKSGGCSLLALPAATVLDKKYYFSLPRDSRLKRRPKIMIRTVFFYIFLVIWTVVLANAVLLVALVAPQSGLMHKIGRFWSRSLLKVAGVKLQVSGLEHLQPGQSYIYAANHQSAFDIFALIAALPYPVNFLAKIELFAIPFFGLAIKKMGCLPVDRSNRQAAVHSLEQAAAAVREGNSLIIFPEGPAA